MNVFGFCENKKKILINFENNPKDKKLILENLYKLLIILNEN